MAPRTGTADQMQRQAEAQARAQSSFLANAQQGISAGRVGAGSRSPDTMEQASRAAVGLPTIGSPNYPKTLAEQLAAVPASFWASGSQGRGGGGGQQTSVAPPAETSTGGGGGIPDFRVPTEPSTSMSNVDATRQYYADALKFLTDLANRGGQTIGESVARMKADPYNLANAYANLQLAAPTVAANPIAEYAAAAGLSDAQAAAAQQLAAAESAATGRALQNITDVMNTAQQQANLSRLADIGLIETGAQQDLQDRLATMALALKQSELGAITGLQQQNLQNQLNMRNAIANQISNVFAGQNVAPESILKLIQETLNRMNMSQWTNIPGMGA